MSTDADALLETVDILSRPDETPRSFEVSLICRPGGYRAPTR